MKKVVIVHCWEGYPEYCWYPQTKWELEEKGFRVEVPEMPETNTPKLSLWLTKLKETIGNPDEELFLIGHSVGCITIMRYLEGLEEGQRVGGVVFVAGFTDDLGYEELANFYETPLDFEKIRGRAKKFVAINSDNDPYVSIKYAEEFRVKLGASVIIKHEFGHFSGTEENERVTSLPDVTEQILIMALGI